METTDRSFLELYQELVGDDPPVCALDTLLHSSSGEENDDGGLALEPHCSPLAFSPKSASSGGSHFQMLHSPTAVAHYFMPSCGMQHDALFFSDGGEQEGGTEVEPSAESIQADTSQMVSTSGSARQLLESDDASCQLRKKPKLEWTPPLHASFVQAVEALAPGKQVPSRILELMGPWAAGLTRANIASHLQKYRARRRGAPYVATCCGGGGGGGSCEGLLPAAAAPGRWGVPPPDPVTGIALGLPLYSLPPTMAAYQPTTLPLGAPVPVPASLQHALDRVLSRQAGSLPLGLKLDHTAILAEMNGACCNASFPSGSSC